MAKIIITKFMPGQDQESTRVPVHNTRPEAGLASAAAAAEPAAAAATTAKSAAAAAAGDWTSSAATDTNLHLTLTPIILMHCLMYFILQICEMSFKRRNSSGGEGGGGQVECTLYAIFKTLCFSNTVPLSYLSVFLIRGGQVQSAPLQLLPTCSS